VGGPSFEFETRGSALMIGSVEIAHPVVDSRPTRKVGSESEHLRQYRQRALKRFIVTFDYGHAVMY